MLDSHPLKTIAAGDLTLAYREAGEGEAIIFLHGIGASSEAWIAQLQAFAATHRAIAWDAPGYGGSGDLVPLAPTAGDYADALSGLFDALGVARAHLVANSLGALMAAAFARRHPQRVLGMVLSDAATGHARLSHEQRNEKLMQRLDDIAELGAAGMARKRAPNLLGSEAPLGTLNRVISIMSKVRPKGYGQAARMLSLGDIHAELAGCRAPTLVVCGAEDAITPPASNRLIAAAASDARFELMEGVGHLPYVEAPERFNALVAGFLEHAATRAKEGVER